MIAREEPQPAPNQIALLRVSPECVGIDAVQEHGDPATGARRRESRVADVARHGHDAWKSPEHPPIERIVDPAFPPTLFRSSRGTSRPGSPRSASQKPREQIRLVLVAVDDVDLWSLRASQRDQIERSNECRSRTST